MGDALAYSWSDGNPVFAIFALENGMLIGWDLGSKASTSILELTSRSRDEEMALYRSQNANQNGGPTQSQYWPLSNTWIENTDPRQAKYNGANHYLYVSGWGGGKDAYNLPEDWYLGNYGTSIRTENYLAGFTSPVGSTIATGVSGIATMIGSKMGAIPAFGGPVGFVIFVIDVASLSTWDTSYSTVNEYLGPAQPVPVP